MQFFYVIAYTYLGDYMPSKRKIIISLIIFDTALSLSIGLISSNIITSSIISGITFIFVGSILHKIYLKAYPKETKISEINEPIKKEELKSSEKPPTYSKNLKLSRILKRKL